MGNPDLLSQEVRKKIIDEIKSNENLARKAKEQRKFDIYRKRQDKYILDRLISEFDVKTVREMRKVLSINPAKRIVDEQASLYIDEPERHFAAATDAEKEQLKEIYKEGRVNPQMRLANRYYKLHSQACLYVLPKDNKICARALTPKDYDVIPDSDDPEKAFAYVINVWDKDSYLSQGSGEPVDWSDNRYQNVEQSNDQKNQQIADQNDRKSVQDRYVFWTADIHFTCNGKGEIVSEAYAGDELVEAGPVQPNPIGRLPFIDIANEKDFSFFVQMGSDVTDFVIDFLVQLSDLANTCRFQNYSQAIIYSTDQPKNINVGPNRVLWLEIDKNADAGQRPQFNFESPSPDIMGSLEFLNAQLKMFLSSVGLNPGTVSGKNEMEKFTSGVDHLLANLDKFKASKEDIDLFKQVEKETFEVICAWQNALFDVTLGTTINEALKKTRLNVDKITVDVSFHEPQDVMTQSEIEDSCIKRMKSGLMTRKEAIKRIYGVDDERADEIILELDEEKQKNMDQGLGPDGQPLPVNPFGEDNEGDAQEVDPKTGKPIVPSPKNGKPVFGKKKPAGKQKPKPKLDEEQEDESA